jgi:hypothetical protein
MTLRKDAEKAAKDAIAKWDEDSDGTPQGFRKHIADAIEREAKRFAERALRAHDDELRCKCDDCKARISKAIEAAERDES